MAHTTEQLKALEKKLVSDLETVRRVIALDANPDLIRVSELLSEININGTATPKLLFESPVSLPPQKGSVKNKEIAVVLMKFATPFKFVDAVAAVKKEFPDRQLKNFSIPAVLRRLREAGKIKEIVPREGRNGATYAKA